MATAISLINAEQFAAMPETLDPLELVGGRLIKLHRSMPRHGEICSNVCYALSLHLNQHPFGRVVICNSSILLARDPDTVRGADIAYYSYERVPKGPLPAGFLPVSPEVVFEVLSPNDRWSEVHAKVADYVSAGVLVVCVLDDESRALHAFYADRPASVLSAEGELMLPHVLNDFRVPVACLFE